MSVEENKKLALEYLELIARGENAKAFEMLAEDLKWWAPDSLPGAGFITKQQIMDKMAAVSDDWAEPMSFEIKYVTAEDDRVAIMMTSRARRAGGRLYSQVYHQLMVFRDGKIIEGYPFFDTLEFAKQVHGATVTFPH